MIYPTVLWPFKFMPNCSVGPSGCETKFSSKKFGMCYEKMHGFHGNFLYDSRDWGKAYKFNHI